MEGQVAQAEITNLIGKLYEGKQERFPYERAIEIIKLSSWIMFPEEPRVLQHAQTTAAANLIRMLSSRELRRGNNRTEVIEEIARAVLLPIAVADSLLNPPLAHPFSMEIEAQSPDYWDAVDIVQFFFRCPKDLKPSLNKAIFFLESGGLGDERTMSAASLRSYWVKYAVSASFPVAEQLLGHSIIGLAPDSKAALKTAIKLADKPDELRTYLSAVKNVQETLISKLDEKSRARFKFIRFPEAVGDDVDVEHNPYETNQVELIRKYRAPVPEH